MKGSEYERNLHMARLIFASARAENPDFAGAAIER
jgi:hypothetical protein